MFVLAHDDEWVPGQNGDKPKRRKSKRRHQNGDNPKRRQYKGNITKTATKNKGQPNASRKVANY